MTQPTQSTPELDEIEQMLGKGIGRTRYADDEEHYFAGMWVDHDGKSAIDLRPLAKQINKLITSKQEKRDQEIADWLEYKLDVFNGACNKCAGKLVEIRPEYPQGQKRTVCPTCLDDIRIGVISNLRPQMASAQLHQGRGSE